MPKCTNCSTVDAALNEEDLCKPCLEMNRTVDTYELMDECLDDGYTSTNDILPNVTTQERKITNDIEKEMITQQLQKQKEYVNLLKNQIYYLKGDIDVLQNDITHKNVVIKKLVGGIRNGNESVCKSEVSSETSSSSSSCSSSDFSDDDEEEPRQFQRHLNDRLNGTWNVVDHNISRKHTINENMDRENIISENPRHPLLMNDDSDFEKELAKYLTNPKRSPRLGRRQYNDRTTSVNKQIYVDSNYSAITKKGNQKCLLPDSCSKRLDVMEFVKHSKYRRPIGRLFMRSTTSQIEHCVEPTLSEHSLDVAVIYVGKNNLTANKVIRPEHIK